MEILGVKVDNLTSEEVLLRVNAFFNDGGRHYAVTPNPEFLVEAQRNSEFKKILNEADLRVADGIGLVLVSKIFFGKTVNRFCGVDLMESICSEAEKRQWRVYLFGGQRGVGLKAAENLKKKYPDLKIRDITFLEGREEEAEKYLEEGKPAVVFVGLGALKQEFWIRKNLVGLPGVRLAMGVGGSLDFFARRIVRAPFFIRKIGLEWLWRLVLEPKRAPRIYRAIVKFPCLVCLQRIKKAIWR